MLAPLEAALSARGYTELTPVQQAVTGPELAGRDLLVSAQTGSGKTVAFGLALGPTLLGAADSFGPAATPLGLIVAPTRELALQVARELRWLYAGLDARLATCVGGMDMRDERRALERGAHVVVATPGRLRDHIMRGSIDLGSIRGVVLDEADEMLDLGFSEDLEFILGSCPDDRRTLMFSATVPPSIIGLTRQYQTNAERITVGAGASQHADITYQAMVVAPHDTEGAIVNILRLYDAPNAIVFCNTRAAVARITTRLSNRGFAVVALSGELTQSERTNALQAMRDGRARVCVATDVAARGIDLPGLDLVVHADLPGSPDTLLHRSGRTGRAGRKGTSALIVTPKMKPKASRVLKWAKLTAEWGDAPSADAVRARDQDRLLNDPMWTEPATESEADLAARLSKAFSADQLALAVARMHASRHSAPEDLGAVTTSAQDRPPFGPSTWFQLAGGRAQGAEVRRILPQLCKAAGITKDEIGAIRIQQDVTLVEIKQSSADRVAAAKLEDGSAPEPASAPPKGAGKPPFKPQRSNGASATSSGPGPRGPRGKSQPGDGARPATPETKPKAASTPRKRSDGPPKARAPKSPSPMERAVSDGAVKPRGPKPKGKAASKGQTPGKPGSKPGPSASKTSPRVHPATGKPMAPKVGKPNSKKNKARRCRRRCPATAPKTLGFVRVERVAQPVA
ncbi:MAG: DEAD/DEAH box helicase [Pseudomonadota bacterium]